MNALIDYLNDEAEIVLRPDLLALALLGVLAVHEHSYLDAFMRRTDSTSSAKYSRCDACGNNPNGYLWCATVMAIAERVGVDLPKPADDSAA